MVATNRTTSSALVDRLQRLEAEPYRFGFLSLLRFIEAYHPDLPRLGRAKLPSTEPLRLGQQPTMAFAPAALASFRQEKDDVPALLESYFFGLFGPNGPMPLHLTEYIYDREHNEDDYTIRAFANIFHHRMFSFFYRAWADGQPTVALDRPSDRRFDDYVGALHGVIGASFRGRDRIRDDAKHFWSGRLALHTRPADGLCGVLEGYFALRFTLRELVGEWLALPGPDRLVLGALNGAAALGVNTITGQRIWSCQHRIELVAGPLTYQEFSNLLPGEPSFRHPRDLLRNYLGEAYACGCRLMLEREQVPRMQLGQVGQLGWSTWLGSRARDSHAGDVVIHPLGAAA